MDFYGETIGTQQYFRYIAMSATEGCPLSGVPLYFSMGVLPQYVTPGDIPGCSAYSVVAPFSADIDTTRTGSVRYTQFTTSDSQMNSVYIVASSDSSLVAAFMEPRMMVAEWRGVPKYQGFIVSCTMFLFVCPWATWCGSKYMTVHKCREECLVLLQRNKFPLCPVVTFECTCI